MLKYYVYASPAPTPGAPRNFLTPPRPVPGRPRPTCKVSALYPENSANASRQTETDNPLYRYAARAFTMLKYYVYHVCPPPPPLPVHPRCTPKFLTPPRPVPGRPRPTCKVSALYPENSANASRQTETDNPLYRYAARAFTMLKYYVYHVCPPPPPLPVHPRCTPKFLTPPRPVPGRPRPTCKVSALYLENCANASRQTETETDRQTILFIDILAGLPALPGPLRR